MHSLADHNWFDTCNGIELVSSFIVIGHHIHNSFSYPKWLLIHKSLQLDVDNHYGLVEYLSSKLCNFGEIKKWTSNKESMNREYLNEHRQ